MRTANRDSIMLVMFFLYFNVNNVGAAQILNVSELDRLKVVTSQDNADIVLIWYERCKQITE